MGDLLKSLGVPLLLPVFDYTKKKKNNNKILL